MQIQGDYHSHSNPGYEPAHTHHITKCLHEEEHTKQQAAAAGIKSKAPSAGSPKESADINGLDGLAGSIRGKNGTGSGKPGFIREFWNQLGEEKEDGKKKERILPEREEARRESGVTAAGISAVSAAIRQLVPTAVITRLGNVREKIKAGIGTALRRFGKREDDFGTLSNPGSYFGGKRKEKEGFSEKTEKGVRQADQEIITATFSDSYLMDSYSKTGRYCRLNENMTYQKSREEKEDTKY